MLAEAVEPRPAAGRDHDAVDPELPVALSGGPAGEVRVVALAGDDQRRQHPGPLAPPLAQQLGHDGVRSPGLDGTAAIRAVLHSQAHEEEPQEVIGLGEGRHRALAPPAARALLDGHGRRDAEHRVDLGPARRLHELPGVGVERLQIPALAFREEDVEGQRALATSAHPRDHGEAVARDGDVDPLQVVLPGIEDPDGTRAPSPREVRSAGGGALTRRGGSRRNGRGLTRAHRPQRRPRVARRVGRHLRRGPRADQLAATVPALGSEVDDPVGGAHHLQVVLDHHHRVAGLHQRLQRPQERRDVLGVQPRRRLVEEEQNRNGDILLFPRAA